MTRAPWIRGLVLVALTGAAGSPLAFADGLRASPAVRVIHVDGPAGATGTIQLENTGPTAIEIQSVTPRASCASEVTLDAMAPFTIEPGGRHALEIACDGAIEAGMKRCTFDVGGANGPLLQLEGVCEGGAVPGLVATTTQIDLGAVTVGASAGATHVLTNTSAATLTRLSFHTTDLDGAFEIGAPCTMDARACDASVGELGPAATHAFTVWCRPKATGPATAELYITSDAGTYLAGPIALACEGTPAAAPVLAVTGTPVNGGAVALGTDELSPPVLRLRNAGAGTLKLTNITIASGAPDWSYTASGACVAPPGGALEPGCELAPGEEVTLSLRFAPRALGLRTGTLLVDYEDTAARQLAIPLAGHGLGGTLALVGSTSELDFGRVPQNATSELTLRLGNPGNRALTDVVVAPLPAGPPFAAAGPSPFTVAPASDTLVTVTCTPTEPGVADAAFQVGSPTALDALTIDLATTCEGSDEPLHAAPTSVALGDVRTSTAPAPVPIELRGREPVMIAEVVLETPSTQLALSGPTSGPTPLALELAVAPTSDGDLRNAILVRAASGDVLRIPISGRVVTPAHTAPPAHSLGTFCVGQPTTPGAVALRSTGSGAARVMVPRMQGAASSPFDLEPVAPTVFPALLSPDDRAVVQVIPRRQSAPGIVRDDLIWTTDDASTPTATTSVSATFLSDGGAIAPTSLDFGAVQTHGSSEPRTITLQNCDRAPIRLDAPQLRAPFTLERGTFPILLEPNEVETIAVGFRPAQPGTYTQTMTIPSTQLAMPLEVTLAGEAVSAGIDDDTIVSDEDRERSFYGCGGCTTQDPGGVLALALVAGAALAPRRRRR